MSRSGKRAGGKGLDVYLEILEQFAVARSLALEVEKAAPGQLHVRIGKKGKSEYDIVLHPPAHGSLKQGSVAVVWHNGSVDVCTPWSDNEPAQSGPPSLEAWLRQEFPPTPTD